MLGLASLRPVLSVIAAARIARPIFHAISPGLARYSLLVSFLAPNASHFGGGL